MICQGVVLAGSNNPSIPRTYQRIWQSTGRKPGRCFDVVERSGCGSDKYPGAPRLGAGGDIISGYCGGATRFRSGGSCMRHDSHLPGANGPLIGLE